MSRVARDFSWHLFALAIVVAGLSILAPLTWWQAGGNLFLSRSHRNPVAAVHREALTLGHRDQVVIAKLPLPEPQIAAIGPLIADEIFLDPSVKETPALPTGGPELSDEALQIQPPGELRLSATIVRPTQPVLPEPRRSRRCGSLPNRRGRARLRFLNRHFRRAGRGRIRRRCLSSFMGRDWQRRKLMRGPSRRLRGLHDWRRLPRWPIRRF